MHQKTILIKDADFIVTMDPARRILERASLLIQGNKILECPTQAVTADEVIDAAGKIVYPGFINTHHHFFQTALRFVPEMQNAPLGEWVRILGDYADHFTADDWYDTATTTLAELVLSGCTTTADHCYLIPNGHNEFFDAEIRAAKDMGVRFQPVRGSMTLSSHDGTIFPPSICQPLDVVLAEIQRSVDTYHDASFGSMCRVAAGPCFPVFPVSSSEAEMRQVMALCRKNGIRMHTHVAEEIDEFDYTVQTHGKTPVEYMESIGCLGPDVWLAHCLFLTTGDIQILQRTGTSIASCPSANSRGAGIARVTECLAAGIPVGVGVDGAAGNDTSNILSELRMLRTLQGAREGVLHSYLINHGPAVRAELAADARGISYLQLEKLLEVATVHGAQALGREKEIGSLEAGKLADVVVFDDRAVSHAGAVSRVGSIFSCTPLRVDYSIINGAVVVRKGELENADEDAIIRNQNETTKRLIGA